MKRTLLGLLLVLVGCEAGKVGGSETGPKRDDPGQCRASLDSVVPLFAPGPAESGPIVFTRADGVIVTSAAGRVRPRHEREDRFMHFEAHYFENRSYRFVIEDFTPLGQSKIKVTYYPVADPSVFGPTTNFRAWKVYGSPQGNGPDHYTFADNGTLTEVAPRQLEKTVTRNARDSREIKVGDIFDFEFGIFLAGFNGMDPTSIGEGAKSYYSDTFRYRVGKGGLTPETFDDTGLLGPSLPAARLGGDLTVPHIAWADGAPISPELAFSQLALNIQAPHQQKLLEGRRLFHTEFDTGKHTEPYNPVFTEQAGKLGPTFNVKSCSACHQHNGRGVLPDVGGEVESVVLRLPGDSEFGRQLQPQEAKVMLAGFETHEVKLDGLTVTLKKPQFQTGKTLKTSPRIARQLVGMGLLEALDESQLLASADEHDCDGNGISGRPALVNDPSTGEPRLGRFGWKAEKVSVRHQVADALEVDLGVTTSVISNGGAPELADADLERLTVYMQLLGVLPQRDAESAQVQRGKVLFGSIGCVSCHTPTQVTGQNHPFQELRGQEIHPFSDLLLHDLGPELADDSGNADASEWRTAPLWGVGFTAQTAGKVNLLHDGRAGSVLEAVLWHGGEAQRMRDTVVSLQAADRDALVAFLESL